MINYKTRKFANRLSIMLFVGVCLVLISFTNQTKFSSNANVTIPANQEFVLGEYQNSSYKAKLNNTSDKLMEISVVNKESNEQTQGFGLDGKGQATVYIGKDEKVLLKNPNDEEITVKVKLSKNGEGMRYQEMGAFEAD